MHDFLRDSVLSQIFDHDQWRRCQQCYNTIIRRMFVAPKGKEFVFFLKMVQIVGKAAECERKRLDTAV